VAIESSSTQHATRTERGAVSIEYSLLALLIAVALVAAMTAVQVDITEVFGRAESGLEAVL